jgi:hypothetical protein
MKEVKPEEMSKTKPSCSTIKIREDINSDEILFSKKNSDEIES